MKPADYRRLVAAGLTPDQVALVMEMMDRDNEERKAQQRARWRKYQENKRNSNVSQREPTLVNGSREGDARGEDKTSTQRIEPQEKEEVRDKRVEGVAGFRAELSPDVAAEPLAAFISVRRQKRAALTAYAGKLFRKDAAAVGMSVAEAVDECVRSSWITVKPEYLHGRARAGPAPPRTSSLADAAKRLATELGQARELQSRDSGSSLRPALPDLSVVSGGRR